MHETHKFHFLIIFLLKYGSYGTIHTFKNYFTFSKISSTQKNPERPRILTHTTSDLNLIAYHQSSQQLQING